MSKEFAVRLTEQLYLLCRLVGAAVTRAAPKPVHHLWILDGSGSMGWTMRAALEALKKKTDTLRDGDYLSFAFFSSRRDWSYPIKGFHVTPETRAQLHKLFDNLRPPYNLTNFSGVLDEAANVIDGLSFLGAKHVVWFLSDGMANDPGVSAEHRETERILRDKLANRVTAMMTVSFGDYADRPFLAQMARICGGECIQSSELQEFSEALARFIEQAGEYEARTFTDAPAGTLAAFAVTDAGGITSYEVGVDNTVSLPLSAGDNYVYFILDRAPRSPRPADGLFLHEVELPFGRAQLGDEQNVRAVRGGLAAAVVLSQMERRGDALELLGEVGDVRLINGFANAFTPSEIGAAENAVAEAVADPAGNLFRDGWDRLYLPRKDAFCLLDAADVLVADEKVRVHTRHPSFRYKRIGRGSVPRPGYPEFLPEPGGASPMIDLVWNKKLLNMSFKVKIKGSVILPDAITLPDVAPPAGSPAQTVAELAASVGSKLTGAPPPAPAPKTLKRPRRIPATFKAEQWRNYALVKDAFLNVRALPAEVSEATFNLFQREGVIEFTDVWEEGKVFVLYLERLPVINRAMAEGERSAEQMCRHQLEALRLEARAKAFNFLRNELDPEKTVAKKPWAAQWSEEELAFLRAAGFKDDGSFDPPSDQAEKTDFYEANRFQLKAKGLSDFPSVAEMREKKKALDEKNSKVTDPAKKKTFTVSQQYVANAMADAADVLGGGVWTGLHAGYPEDWKSNIQWLDDELAEIKERLAFARGHIQRPKFVIALTHTWFPDPGMSPRKPEGNTITVDGIEFTVVVDKEVVHI